MASLKRKANRRKKIVKRIMDNMEPCTRGIGDFRKDIDVQAIYRNMAKMHEQAEELCLYQPDENLWRFSPKIVYPESYLKQKGTIL